MNSRPSSVLAGFLAMAATIPNPLSMLEKWDIPSKKGRNSKHTKKGVGRGCFRPAGSKSSLKKMDWAMMRVFFPEEVT